jgi:hypothetical protein
MVGHRQERRGSAHCCSQRGEKEGKNEGAAAGGRGVRGYGFAAPRMRNKRGRGGCGAVVAVGGGDLDHGGWGLTFLSVRKTTEGNKGERGQRVTGWRWVSPGEEKKARGRERLG